jgi:hypothetical protein
MAGPQLRPLSIMYFTERRDDLTAAGLCLSLWHENAPTPGITMSPRSDVYEKLGFEVPMFRVGGLSVRFSFPTQKWQQKRQ